MAEEIEVLNNSGDSGTFTPESMRMRRRLAEAMMRTGADTTPIRSHWQGLARIANAMIGGYQARRMEQDEAKQNSLGGQANAARYGLGPSLSSAPGAPVAPKPADVADASQPAPASGTPDFREWVKKKEGWNPNAYGDYKQTSIGYGTRANPGEKTISREEGEKRLDVELSKARMLVQSWGQGQGVKLSPKQEDALTDLTYNAGTTWMNEGLAAAMKSGNLPVAKRLFEAYINAGGKPLDGLITRRKELSPWLLDTSSGPAPVQVAQAQQPGVIPDVPQPIPGVAIEGGGAAAAPPVAAQSVPAPAPSVGPAPAAAAPGAPGATPGTPAMTPQLPTRGQVAAPALSDHQINEAALASLGQGRAAVEAMIRHSNPEVQKRGNAIVDPIIARIRSRQMPEGPMEQAKLAESLSKTRENEAQLPKHQADARKANIEATAAERDMRPAREDVAIQVRDALEDLARIPHEFGRQATEYSLGPWSTAEDVGGVSGAVNTIGGGIARMRGESAAKYLGGPVPTEVRNAVNQRLETLVSILKPYIRAKGEGAQQVAELLQLQKTVGTGVKEARTVEEFNRAVENSRHSITNLIRAQVPELREVGRSSSGPQHAEEVTTPGEAAMDARGPGLVKSALEKANHAIYGIPGRPDGASGKAGMTPAQSVLYDRMVAAGANPQEAQVAVMKLLQGAQ
jgi:GH24 family phage-related lysozyme (muramidase)